MRSLFPSVMVIIVLFYSLATGCSNAVTLFSEYSNSGIWRDCYQDTKRDTLYVIRTSDVPDSTYYLVVEGLEKIINEVDRNIEVLPETDLSANGYMSPDRYQSETMLDKTDYHGQQSNASEIIELLRAHDSTNDHFLVLITDADITTGTPGNNFIFGLSSYPYIVLSARRFIDWKNSGMGGYSSEVYDQALSMVAAHEFGHYLDLVQREENCHTGTGTILDHHCKGEDGRCLMQQCNVEGCPTALDQAEDFFDRNHWLCDDCRAEIEARREALEDEGFDW